MSDPGSPNALRATTESDALDNGISKAHSTEIADPAPVAHQAKKPAAPEAVVGNGSLADAESDDEQDKKQASKKVQSDSPSAPKISSPAASTAAGPRASGDTNTNGPAATPPAAAIKSAASGDLPRTSSAGIPTHTSSTGNAALPSTASGPTARSSSSGMPTSPDASGGPSRSSSTGLTPSGSGPLRSSSSGLPASASKSPAAAGAAAAERKPSSSGHAGSGGAADAAADADQHQPTDDSAPPKVRALREQLSQNGTVALTGGSMQPASPEPRPQQGPSRRVSEHDKINNTNALELLQKPFKLSPGKDVVPYEKLITLRLEDGVDVTRKEEYLSAEEFLKVFKVDRDTYTKMPQWKRLQLKKSVMLF